MQNYLNFMVFYLNYSNFKFNSIQNSNWELVNGESQCVNAVLIDS